MKVFGGKTLPRSDKKVYYLKPDGTWGSWPKPKLPDNRMRAGCIYFDCKCNKRISNSFSIRARALVSFLD